MERERKRERLRSSGQNEGVRKFGSCGSRQLSFSRPKSEVISSTGQNSLSVGLSQARPPSLLRWQRRANIGGSNAGPKAGEFIIFCPLPAILDAASGESLDLSLAFPRHWTRSLDDSHWRVSVRTRAQRRS